MPVTPGSTVSVAPLIYVLLAAQTQSFGIPLIIMSAIPLTLIGLLPGCFGFLARRCELRGQFGGVALELCEA